MAPPKQFSRKDLDAALAKGKANAGTSRSRPPKRVLVSSRQYWFLNKAGHGDDVIDSKVSACMRGKDEGGLCHPWITY